MKLKTSTYVATSSAVHDCDARVKIALLFAFTICIFFADTWPGLLTFTALTLAIMTVSHVPFKNYFGMLVPVYVIMGFTLVFNMFADSDILVLLGPLPLAITASGLSRGCFFALRILLLCLASMIVCFTSTSTALSGALGWAIHPLRKLHIPVDDITTALSIALRFIPLLAIEVERKRDAHWSRGGHFDGGPTQALSAWGRVFVAVFVGMFRRADNLSSAMDARCYGLPGVSRTQAGIARMNATSAIPLVAGLVIFIAVAIFL